ncbi:sensor histidine kinase [Paenibacillus oenotherae]|uniref:histidine kinase n=1 Tax=Paenibacillus oenotherae TaxID=1435645 RepID=A0ABS7D3C6_9BACL|nr:sensor histidine kinase [Paenibacillus oenotherae]MBW7474422.1 sensor histidine kinase [Paenibacillus oenotherae]
MNLAKWPKRYRLPYLMAALTLVLFAIAVAQNYVVSDNSRPAPILMEKVRIAESSSAPPDHATGTPSGTHWMKVREMFPHYDGLLPPGRYWLKYTPVKESWQLNPSIYVRIVNYFRLYVDGQELYRFDTTNTDAPVNPYYNWHLIPADSKLMGKDLTLWLDTSGMKVPLPYLAIDQPEDVLYFMIRFELGNYMLAALFIFCAIAALFFCFTRRESAYIYLFMFAFTAGYASLVRNQSFKLFVDSTWFSYLHDIALPFCVFAFVGFVERLYPELYPRTHRYLRWGLLAFSLLTAVSSLVSPYLYYLLLMTYFPPLFLIVFAAVTRTIYRAYRKYDEVENSWMMAGFAIVTINALLHIMSTSLPAYYDMLAGLFPPLLFWNNTLLFWSIFLLMICFVRVLYGRYESVNRQLETFNRSLEDMVQQRTAELEDTHLRLTESMRDSAEATAATLVMEERQRIAYTIHDTVGHTLTATIVQIEAAKRLMDKDKELALSKFEASQQLVRKGLDEIRGSVRLLQEDPADYDLLGAMDKLIAETAAATGIIVEKELEALPEGLTIFQKRVLYHALQEGLTNGIRHGKCDRFTFQLTYRNQLLSFQLSNNGLPYTKAEFGFGLKAMEDRVQQLGGTLRIDPGASGCVLTLILPVKNNMH